MATLDTRILVQDAVYWAPGPPNAAGRPTYPYGPVAIKCWWDANSETYVAENGERRGSMANVYCDRIVNQRGYLWKGLIKHLPRDADPAQIPNAFEIKAYHEPHSRNGKVLRIARL